MAPRRQGRTAKGGVVVAQEAPLIERTSIMPLPGEKIVREIGDIRGTWAIFLTNARLIFFERTRFLLILPDTEQFSMALLRDIEYVGSLSKKPTRWLLAWGIVLVPVLIGVGLLLYWFLVRHRYLLFSVGGRDRFFFPLRLYFSPAEMPTADEFVSECFRLKGEQLARLS